VANLHEENGWPMTYIWWLRHLGRLIFVNIGYFLQKSRRFVAILQNVYLCRVAHKTRLEWLIVAIIRHLLQRGENA